MQSCQPLPLRPGRPATIRGAVRARRQQCGPRLCEGSGTRTVAGTVGAGLRRVRSRLPPHHREGTGLHDEVGEGGSLHDPDRAAALERHLEAAASAVRRGAPLHGSCARPLVDNFEQRLLVCGGVGTSRLRAGLSCCGSEVGARRVRAPRAARRVCCARQQVE
jgi:hypothetical protein